MLALLEMEMEMVGLWYTVFSLCVFVCPHFLHESSINEAAETITWWYYIIPLTQWRNVITATFFRAASRFHRRFLGRQAVVL